MHSIRRREARGSHTKPASKPPLASRLNHFPVTISINPAEMKPAEAIGEYPMNLSLPVQMISFANLLDRPVFCSYDIGTASSFFDQASRCRPRLPTCQRSAQRVMQQFQELINCRFHCGQLSRSGSTAVCASMFALVSRRAQIFEDADLWRSSAKQSQPGAVKEALA